MSGREGTVALSIRVMARREIFPVRQVRAATRWTPSAAKAHLWGQPAGPWAEVGRRSCGANVAGWLNATVPLQRQGTAARLMLMVKLLLMVKPKQTCLDRPMGDVTGLERAERDARG